MNYKKKLKKKWEITSNKARFDVHMKKTILLLVIFSVLIIIGCVIYKINIGPVSKNQELKEIEVKKGASYLTIASLLKENNLIKSEHFYKIYIKLSEPKPLEACTFKLSENMGVKKIVKELEKGCKSNLNAVKITIPEGRHLEQVAEIVAKQTNNTKEQLMKVWNSTDFINKVIEKYEFVTNEIKMKGIRYPLEGYLFPSTYELQSKDVTPEYVAYKMLDQMQVIYNKYKEDIKKSKYTFHQILTMASIVEYEAILDEERPIITGVFYNRLENPGYETVGLLQSCATLGYAIGEWKLRYSDHDIYVRGVSSPYNTYLYKGLPIGPGGMPGEKSIKAAIYPAKTEYYYFMANVCDPNNKKSIFAKTYAEHERNQKKYLCQ